MKKKYKYLTKSTILRRYYDCKKILEKINISTNVIKHVVWKYAGQDKINPHPLKLIMIKDMIRLKMKIDRNYLLKHGFSNLEINWLVDEGLIKLDEKIL
jgi:hypothetical protein